MGRPPGNGQPTFRFSSNEVEEMQNILREHKGQVPAREILEALARKFSSSEERSGKMKVEDKQVWNWFQNRRFALRSRQVKPPEMVSAPPPLPRFNSSATRNAQMALNRNVPQAPQPGTSHAAVQSGGRPVSDNTPMEFEAKSARDGAWYDVASFLTTRSSAAAEMDVKVRFAGFGEEEDEWVNVRKHVRLRSLPCEATECVAILPGDLILCFQEGKEQALYYDAHVIDSQRRRHDVRGCRCRFLVRYDHDQSEEIVPLKKVCRRPETDYRLLQLQSMNESMKQQKNNAETPHMGNTLRVHPPFELMPKPPKDEDSVSHGNRPSTTEAKNLPTENPGMGPASAMNIPAVPPGFEAVSSAGNNSNSSGDPSVAIEVKSVVPKNPEVVAPVSTEKPVGTDNLEVITPLTIEGKTVQTKISERSAGGVVVGISTVPPGFEDVTRSAVTKSTTSETPVDMEVKSLPTKTPEVGAGKTLPLSLNNNEISGGVVGISAIPPGFEDGISAIPPGFEDVTSTAVTKSTSSDTPVTIEVKSLSIKNPEVGAGDAGETLRVSPSNDAVTNSIVSCDTPVALEIQPETKHSEVSASETVTIPTLPPGFDAVTTGNTPVAMEAEFRQTDNPQVTTADGGETLSVPSSNEAVPNGSTPDRKTAADTSIPMEVDSLQTENLEVTVANAGKFSNVLSSNEAVSSGSTPDSKSGADDTVAMEVDPLQTKDPVVTAGDTSTVPHD